MRIMLGAIEIACFDDGESDTCGLTQICNYQQQLGTVSWWFLGSLHIAPYLQNAFSLETNSNVQPCTSTYLNRFAEINLIHIDPYFTDGVVVGISIKVQYF